MRNNTGTRITADLGDPKWLRLLRLEASEKGENIRDVLVSALSLYFADRLETKALMAVSEKVFEEWNNPLDQEYDKL